MKHKISNTNRLIRHKLAVRHAGSRSKRQAISDIAKSLGLSYLGKSAENRPDHIIGGYTASLSHRDIHFMAGKLSDYQIYITERYDIHALPQAPNRRSRIFVTEIDLNIRKDIPHIFIAPHNIDITVYDRLFMVYPALKPIDLAQPDHNYSEFNDHYTIYARPAVSELCKGIFSPSTTKHMVGRLWPFAIETHHGKLYLYTDEHPITKELLEQIINQGLWLAKVFDNTEVS